MSGGRVQARKYIADLAVVLERKVESEAADTFGLGARDDLETLYDAWVALVLETRVLAFGVLANDNKVNVVVARWVAGQGLAKHNRRIDVELLAHSYVPGHMSSLCDGGEEDTWEGAKRTMRPTRNLETAPFSPTRFRLSESIA